MMASGSSVVDLSPAVADGVQGGVLTYVDDQVWFRHPLLRDVLTRDSGTAQASSVHAAYAATLVDHVRHLSQAWRFPLAAFLTDETFAVMERRYRTQGGGRNAHWYYIASCAGMYANWQCWTFIGITVGQNYPEVQNWGLEFAMVVTFIGIVVPLLTSMPYLAAAVTAGLVAVIANPLPYKLGLMLAALAGIVVGVVLDIRKRGLTLTTEEDAAHLAPEEKKTWA
jgi:predicted branched-subunit amino acid permease